MSYSYQLDCNAQSQVQGYSGSTDLVFDDFSNLNHQFAQVFLHTGNTLGMGYGAVDEQAQQVPELNMLDYTNQNGPFDFVKPVVAITSPAANSQVSTSGPFTVTIQATDNSSIAKVKATFDANGDGVMGQTEIVTAQPAGGNLYTATFSSVSGSLSARTLTAIATDGSGNSATTSINLTVGNGSQFALTVTEAGTGTGMVSSSPAGINCPSTCSANYTSATMVTLTAAAGTNSTFAGWSGACSGTGSCTVTMSQAQAVTATFNAVTAPTIFRIGTGTLPQGSSSAPAIVTLNFSNSFKLGGFNITTLGAPGANYATTAGGSCVVGNNYTAGSSCTVAVTFTPSGPASDRGSAYCDRQCRRPAKHGESSICEVPLMISQRLLLAIFSTCTCVALTGCGTALHESSGATNLRRGAVSGSLHGGQQPVSGSSVYLFAAATNGYGQISTSLLSGANVLLDNNSRGYVPTAADGSFSITGDYQCPTSTSLVYLVALGGNPGLAAGTNNHALAMAAALGNCTTLKANAATTFVQIDEVTTVAAAYGLAGFMTASDHVGASSTNLTGISNAFITAALLANTVTGASSTATPAGNGAIPQAELYTLADALASCVNSASGSSSTCTALFQATTVNSVVPTDTLQAVLNLAHNPGLNPAAIFNLVGSSPPFQPTLVAAPNDWTVAITYTGNGIATPQSIAIDANGNAWIVNMTNTVTELSAGSGAPLSGATGFVATGLDAPVSLAISTTGSVWIANCGDACSGSGIPSTVTALSANGQSSSNYTSSGLNGAYAIAISGSNQTWVANSLGSSLTQLNPNGTIANPTLLAPTLLYPISVAVSPGGNAFTVSPANNALVGFTAAGTLDPTNNYQGAGLNFPYAVALDHNGNAWVANYGNNSVAQLSGGALVGGAAHSGGGITNPNAIAIDGGGNVWVTNSGNSISGLTNAGSPLSPATGLRNDLVYPNAIAVDASGNLWAASCGKYCMPGNASSGSISLIVGAAIPGVTPLSVAAGNNALGTLP